MGKKKHPETDKEKELLEKRLLKTKIAGVIAATITAISALLTALADCFK